MDISKYILDFLYWADTVYIVFFLLFSIVMLCCLFYFLIKIRSRKSKKQSKEYYVKRLKKFTLFWLIVLIVASAFWWLAENTSFFYGEVVALFLFALIALTLLIGIFSFVKYYKTKNNKYWWWGLILTLFIPGIIFCFLLKIFESVLYDPVMCYAPTLPLPSSFFNSFLPSAFIAYRKDLLKKHRCNLPPNVVEKIIQPKDRS